MNDDTVNIEAVDLSPTRAELIARVRARGRQIRARRRLAVTALTALVVFAVAAPAIAIGARSSSHGVTPATVPHGKGDFRIAVVESLQQTPVHFGGPCLFSVDGKICYELGATLVTARDVKSTSVAYDSVMGWLVNVEMDRTAARRLAAQANHQAAVVVGGKVVSAPVVNPGITGTTITISGTLTREEAIALATEITGSPPAHVAAQPDLTASIELPSTTLVSGTTINATLVIVNHTAHAITLTAGNCPAVWQGEMHALGGSSAATGSLRSNPTTCPPGGSLEPGTNHLSVAVTARAACLPTADTKLGIPACLSNGEGPPLAPGEYEVTASADSENAPIVLPVLVQVVAAPAAPPSLGALSLQTGDRSTKLLVPAGWKFAGIDGGGSGSTSTWTNPADPHEAIFGATGVELGGWWEKDGVNGSIDPSGFFPKGAHTQRVNYTTFLYQLDAGGGYVTDGVWIANVTAQGPDSYVMAHVTLPSALHATATTILNRFISDRNAVFPPLSGPPPAFVRP